MNDMTRNKEHPAPATDGLTTPVKSLVLYNDEVNTFEFVIRTLMEVCSHEYEQAEQCALIAHYKGKCEARCGDYFEVKPMYDEMTFRGLTVSIE